MISWRFLYCPECKRAYKWEYYKIADIVRISSGLGPNTIRCASCNTVFDSGFLEWKQFAITQKIRYGIMSIADALFIGCSLLVSTMTVLGKFPQTAQWLSQFFNPIIFFFIIYSTPIILVQIARIFLSLDRSDEASPKPAEISFWNWETNLQSYGMAIFFACVIVAFAATLL